VKLDRFCSYLIFIWASSLPLAMAEEKSSETQQTLSEDRKYIESNCPHPGMQEIHLYKNGEFKLTSYDLEAKKRTLELSGNWNLSVNFLTLNYEDSSIAYQVENSMQDLLGKRFMMIVLVPVYSDNQLPFTSCNYVDRRLVKEFTGID